MAHTVLFMGENTIRAGEDVLTEAFDITYVRGRLAAWAGNPRYEHRIEAWTLALPVLESWLRSSVSNYIIKLGSQEDVIALPKFSSITAGMEQPQLDEYATTLNEFFGE